MWKQEVVELAQGERDNYEIVGEVTAHPLLALTQGTRASATIFSLLLTEESTK